MTRYKISLIKTVTTVLGHQGDYLRRNKYRSLVRNLAISGAIYLNYSFGALVHDFRYFHALITYVLPSLCNVTFHGMSNKSNWILNVVLTA